jgi:hypothetical protein
MGLPLMSRCSCVGEVSDKSVLEDVLDDVPANVARIRDPSGRSVLDDVWYALDEGLNDVVVSTLKDGAGKTASLPWLRRWFRIEDVSANFL